MFEIVTLCEAQNSRSDDVVEVLEHRDGSVVALADGAGGMSGGGAAADATTRMVREYVRQIDDLAEPGEWSMLLAEIDAEIQDRHGETTCVVAAVSESRIAGASVGDSIAWLIGSDAYIDLTANQICKPLLGSGRAAPVMFAGAWSTETILVASDGLAKYAQPRSICEIARQPDLRQAARSLIDLVRLKSGALPDDVTVALCRRSADDFISSV